MMLQGAHDRDVRFANWLNDHSDGGSLHLDPTDRCPWEDFTIETSTTNGTTAKAGPFGVQAFLERGEWHPMISAKREVAYLRAEAGRMEEQASSLRSAADALEARTAEDAR